MAGPGRACRGSAAGAKKRQGGVASGAGELLGLYDSLQRFLLNLSFKVCGGRMSDLYCLSQAL